MKTNGFFKRIALGVLLVFLTFLNLRAQDTPISLKGEWHICLDPDSVGESKGYFNERFNNKIALPGTTDEAGYGKKTVGSDYGILTRKYKYIGPAWYNKEIVIPESWGDRDVVLHLERVMWQSKVWVDGKQLDIQDGLGTPHYHNLGNLKPGKHLLSVRINNDLIYNIGDKGHCYGEYTQIIWNGVIGKIELLPVTAISLNTLKVWPDVEKKQLKATFILKNDNSAQKTTLYYRLYDKETGLLVQENKEYVSLKKGEIAHSFTLDVKSDIKLWDEFNPNLYKLEIETKARKSSYKQSAEFGFRNITCSKSKILVNGNSVFMRGNLDCVHFPLTGYPSCDVKEWERIFKIYKAHGLNQVRFHSWCPPEAAFQAADKLGIYIQAEVLWIDWWMTENPKDRPEMYTKGLPKGLGQNPSADKFVPEELQRMVDAYGNHPSFAMVCIGNELGNSNFEVMEKWIAKVQKEDNRRIYSVSTARRIMPVDQYMVTHNIPNVGGTYGLQGVGTDFDLENNYSKATIPIIAHELGQCPVYPLWSEIDKYTGVLEARNLLGLSESARKNNIYDMDSKFHYASGSLQNLLYKAYLETLFRTPSCAGFNMLSMTDYSGQGEALIGWLDSFWDSKGIITPQEFSQYSNQVVPLARFKKYVWETTESFTSKIQIANYGKKDIDSVVEWSFADSKGNVVTKGQFDSKISCGKLNDIGDVTIDFSKITEADKYILSLSVKGTSYCNKWNLWVYPPSKTIKSDVLVKEELDKEAMDRLNKGGKVLLIAHKLGKKENTVPINFESLFWSNSFFPGQSNLTLGVYVDKAHSALSKFPTDDYGDWQWERISDGHSFIINNHKDLKPIAQPISDFHINDKLASIFECKVGKGKLMVCGYDITKKNPVAQQLSTSLLSYMAKPEFNPSYSLSAKEVSEMFYYIPQTEKKVPKGFEKSILYVSCGENAESEGATPWSKEHDKVIEQQSKCDYTVSCDNIWKDASGTVWTGKQIIVTMKTPNGVIGDLYVKFEDWNNQNREGVLSIEGRESILGKHTGAGQWVKLFVMREDTNDGKITFKANATKGSNLMISKIAFIKQ